MNRRFLPARYWMVVTLALAVLGPGEARGTPAADFDAFVDRYLAGYYAFRPNQATKDGVHEHDAKLAGFDRMEIDAEIARLRESVAALQAMKPAALDSSRRIDLAILSSRAQGDLLELESVRPWQKDPGYYVALITDGVYALSVRSVAPAPERLRSVIEREKMVGAALGGALENLANPPRAWTEGAIEQAQGAADFFRTTLPPAFASVADTALLAEFARVNGQTVEQIQSFVTYLREDLLPVSNGDFRLGPELFEKKLLYDEMCDVPGYRLERYGDDEVKRLQLEIQNTATRIDQTKTTKDLLRILSVDHPDPGRLVDETGKLLDGIRQFCVDKGIATVPSAERVQVRPAPDFLRRGPIADLDSPGAFETKGREAFYYVTLPRSDWDWQKQDDHMRMYNRYALPVLSMRETWPGRYLQELWRLKSPSKVRKAFGSASFSEGWGAYCGQMMLEEGYADKDSRYQLFQLRLALLDACRYLVAIRMHTGSMTYEQAVDFFVREAYQEPVNAEREARRGMSDPTSLASLLGRFQIFKLREDYRRYRGDRYSLKEFHDSLLAHGEPPLKLLRQILMPGDKGTVL